MPELPEVETTRLGLLPLCQNLSISKVIVRNRKLRYPIESNFEIDCKGQVITDISRRSKYLKIQLENGIILVHLGMSGHLKVTPENTPIQKHDHVDIKLSNNTVIRYTDPRRFGMINFSTLSDQQHPLLSHLGPEPLTNAFNGKYLYKICQGKKKPIKKMIMDNKVVVGVGNIYAQESLFLEGIAPLKPCYQLTQAKCQQLVARIKKVLRQAIKMGGTTLKDFQQVDGKPGYFAQKLYVYGRAGQTCPQCHTVIEKCIIESRTTAFCPNCQKL